MAEPGQVFSALKATCPDDWDAYVRHDFVRRLGDGSLPEACFRHYLGQDYIFLIHFARAYALAAFKSDALEDMRQAAATLDALINTEMGLHVTYCAGWGLSEPEMAALPEAEANLAYTRFVLDTGLAGDLLDLLAALAPCVMGYAEIGAWLAADPASDLSDENPYRDWIEMYAGAEYQEVARGAARQLDRVAARRLGPDPTASPRWAKLARTFGTATRLEIGFWDMGLAPPG
ncbi:MAG: thiaminase II [Proteobacteria bacterium]|nr:thiaminase II [Pseudomonadota bacterium]